MDRNSRLILATSNPAPDYVSSECVCVHDWETASVCEWVRVRACVTVCYTLYVNFLVNTAHDLVKCKTSCANVMSYGAYSLAKRQLIA